MQRRAFLQSLLAGGAALTLPTVTRTVEAEPTADGDPGGAVLEQVFELRNPERWGHELQRQAIGLQVKVPAGGRARVVIKPPKGVPIQVVNLAAQPTAGGEQLTGMVAGDYRPADIRVFSWEGGPVPLDSPVSTHERPFVFELQSHDVEDTDLALGAFFLKVPVGDHPVPQWPTAYDSDHIPPPIDLGPPGGSFTNHWPAKDDDGD